MTDEEFKIAVDSLRKSLEASSLTWIAKEVDETLRLGKPAVRTVIEEKEEASDVLHLPSVLTMGGEQNTSTRRKTTVPTTESYSQKEELGLILDAIERTAIATMDMQSYVITRIANRGGAVIPGQEISFEREGEISSSLPYQNQSDEKVQISNLRKAITLLRERAK